MWGIVLWDATYLSELCQLENEEVLHKNLVMLIPMHFPLLFLSPHTQSLPSILHAII